MLCKIQHRPNSKDTCKQVTALVSTGNSSHMTFFEKKLTCPPRGRLHCLLLTACLFCFACRVTMYDYQAMCKVPYHHHSGARPLLSVRICHRAALPGLGISSTPQKTSGDVCFPVMGMYELTSGRFLKQWWPLMVVSSMALYCHIDLTENWKDQGKDRN